MGPILQFIPSIHAEGYRFILIFLSLSALFFLFSSTMGWLLLALTVACTLFFRDPSRVSPTNLSAVISAADGIVTAITSIKPPVELEMGDEEVTRVSTFLSVFDVHVNRIPVAGKIVKMHYHPGKFISAALDKSSDENERQLVTIEAGQQRFGVVQIAGLIARRIVCNLQVGETVVAGNRYGIIRFGSRVDLYIPKSHAVQVRVGQRMIGGETVVALPR